MAQQIQPGREVTSTTEACPKPPKPPTGSPHQPHITRSPRFNRTHLIALGLTSLTLFSVFSVGQWYMFMLPIPENTVISSTIFGGPEEDEISSLVQLEDGGFIAAGRTASWGGGGDPELPFALWLIRLDENLNILWNQTYGPIFSLVEPALAVCSDGGFALAVIRPYRGILLVRIDENGNHLWTQQFTNHSIYLRHARPWAITQCDDDGFAIAGGTYHEIWLVKTDSTGTPEWHHLYYIDVYHNFNEAGLLAYEPNAGFLFMGGTSLVFIDTDGTLLWHRSYSSTIYSWSFLVTRSGEYLMCGGPGQFTNGPSTWLTRIRANGNLFWLRPVGIAGAAGRGIVECHDGGFAIVGVNDPYDTDSDLCLMRTDSLGTTLWERVYGTEDTYDTGAAILQLADGSFLLAGITNTSSSNTEAWFLRVTDSPTRHYVITQGFLAGVIISLSAITILAVILAYRFIKRRRQPTPT